MNVLTLTHRPSGWWIVGLEDDGQAFDCGPYETKAEAEDDRAGMTRFLRHWDKPYYMSCDSPRERCRQLFA